MPRYFEETTAARRTNVLQERGYPLIDSGMAMCWAISKEFRKPSVRSCRGRSVVREVACGGRWRLSQHPHQVGALVALPKSDKRANRPLPRLFAGEEGKELTLLPLREL